LRVNAGVTVTSTEVIARLRELQVKSFDDGAIIDALERRSTEAFTLDVASGTPPVHERAGKIDFRVPVNQSNDGLTFTKVEPGQVIAKVLPAIPGKPGRDVFGQPIASPAAPSLKTGRNLTTTNGELIATARGNLGVRDGVLSVEPLLEVSTDDPKPIDFDGDLIVKGALTNRRVVRATGSMIVGGPVEAADVRVKGSLHVKGGLISSGGGRCASGGDLWCRFISGANLHVQGHVRVQGDVINGRVVAFKSVDIPRGQICGGHIVANGGVACTTLGNASGTATRIEVGSEATMNTITTATTAEIEAHRTRARQVRDKIGPLMQQLKNLTHQQREKATELLAQASEAEEHAEELATELNSRLEQLRTGEAATVSVQNIAHAGVTIRINGSETVLKDSFKGPLTFSAAKGAAQIILTDSASGTQTGLPTYAATSAVPTPATGGAAKVRLLAA
jgi:uncharacterized protein (DUF342 family)